MGSWEVVVKEYVAFTEPGCHDAYRKDAPQMAGRGYFPITETPPQKIGFGPWMKTVTYRLETRPVVDSAPKGPARAWGRGGVWDSNTKTFVGGQEQEAASPESPAAGSPSSSNVVSELERLKALLDAGALTPEEFAEAKRQILG